MTIRYDNVHSDGSMPAAPVPPQSLALEALDRLEISLTDSLATLRRDLGCSYDPGKLEYESWMQHLRPALRRGEGAR